jgi:hypothetical protein
MKTLYACLVASSLLAFTPSSSQAARRPATDDPTENTRKTAARGRAATKAKADKAAKATKKSKKTSAFRLKKVGSGFSHAMLVLVGMEESKAVTSPAKLNRQLHIHQKHLKMKARMEAKARRRRTSHMFD